MSSDDVGAGHEAARPGPDPVVTARLYVCRQLPVAGRSTVVAVFPE